MVFEVVMKLLVEADSVNEANMNASTDMANRVNADDATLVGYEQIGESKLATLPIVRNPSGKIL